ncbi:MAG: DUF5050 domain-containing protein [Eubacteriales bacterium]
MQQIILKQDVCQQGGYYYYTAHSDSKSIYRMDPDGNFYAIADKHIFHSIQVNGSYVYALEWGELGGYINGLWKVSVNGDSSTRILDDYFIDRYLVFRDAIYFTTACVVDNKQAFYEYCDGEVRELTTSIVDRFYVDDSFVYYSTGDSLCRKNRDTLEFEFILNLPQNCTMWLPIDGGYLFVTESSLYTETLWIQIMNSPLKSLGVIQNDIVSLGIIGEYIYVSCFDSILYLYNPETGENREFPVPENTSEVICSNGQLYARIYSEHTNELLLEKIEPDV